MNDVSIVGQSLPRVDGFAKVTGRALYVDDLRPEGCWYGATVRSTRAHARVVSIEPGPGFDWTDVVLVTAKDIPGRNVVYLKTEDQPALADGLVRHVTEPIALVAAPTRDRALAAARHVRVVYEDLEPLFDHERALGNKIRIYGEDNAFHRVSITRGEPEGKPFSWGRDPGKGRFVQWGIYRTGLQEQLYIEPQGMLAVPREDGGLTLLGSLQCPYYVHAAMVKMLGHDRVNVVQAATGGGFGGKEEYPSMVGIHAALLALKTGKPVKLIYRRDEDLRATTKRHPSTTHIRSVTDAQGNLLEWTAHIVLDGGAYCTLSPVVLSRAVLHLTGPYRCDNVRVSGEVVATHTPPTGAFRGFGAPQALFAVERHMDRIARELRRDPIDVRRRNLYRDGDPTVTGQVLKDTGGLAVLSAAIDAAGAPLSPRLEIPGGGGRFSPGRGLSMVFHGCGFTGNGEAKLAGQVALELTAEGKVRVLVASTDIGQGSETTLCQIAAQELGISMTQVEPAPHDTAVVPDSGPTVASRTCMVVGGCVQEAAKKLRDALQAETGKKTSDFAKLLKARPAPVPLRVDHRYQDSGELFWDDKTYQGDAYPSYGWNCTVVDLDVDLDTGEVRYRRMVTATDVGKAINPVVVAGQIEGGALQALGYATLEEVVLDDTHCMRNDRLTNYIIPTSLDAPEMVTLLIEIPFSGGPFGAKGIGEIPMDGPAAAVAAAIENATGAVLDSLPMTPEYVLPAMARAKKV